MHADTSLGKPKVTLIIVRWTWPYRGLIDHGTHKSGGSHKWFDELGRLIE